MLVWKVSKFISANWPLCCMRFLVRAVYKQLSVFINMLFTVVGSFAFGYFATYYSSYRPETVSVVVKVLSVCINMFHLCSVFWLEQH